MTREDLLRIFLEKPPSARSPYGLQGFPPMWRVDGRGDVDLLARPARTMARHGHAWIEVDGVSWQLRRGETWLDQGKTGTFEDFLRFRAEMLDPPASLEAAP